MSRALDFFRKSTARNSKAQRSAVGERNIHICSPERLKSCRSCPSCPNPKHWVAGNSGNWGTFWSVRLGKINISSQRAGRERRVGPGNFTPSPSQIRT